MRAMIVRTPYMQIGELLEQPQQIQTVDVLH